MGCGAGAFFVARQSARRVLRGRDAEDQSPTSPKSPSMIIIGMMIIIIIIIISIIMIIIIIIIIIVIIIIIIIIIISSSSSSPFEEERAEAGACGRARRSHLPHLLPHLRGGTRHVSYI